MSDIKDRIRELRKETKLSQTDFAERLGCGRGVIKGIEEGQTELKPALADLICRTYNCDPVWLRTGEGEMFRKLSRDEQIAAFVGKALADDSDDFRSQLISILAVLDDVGWQKLKAAAEAIKEAEEKIKST